MDSRKVIEDRKRLEKFAPVAKAAFERELEARNLRFGKESKGRNPNGTILLTDCGSVGFCSIGPAVLVYPEGIWYAQVTAEDVPEIIEEHLENGNVVERLALLEMNDESQ